MSGQDLSLLEAKNNSNPCGNKKQVDALEKNFSELNENFYILLKSVDDLERTSNFLKRQVEVISATLIHSSGLVTTF